MTPLPVGSAWLSWRHPSGKSCQFRAPPLVAFPTTMNEDTVEEIAARTVNKERARAGEAKQASKTSTNDISSGRRGGLRSHRGSGGRTKAQPYGEAKSKGIEGRSKMTKADLEHAIGRRTGR